MKHLIVFRGLTGVGKTTLANSLGEKLHIPVIDKDDIKDVINDRFIDSNEAGALSYEVMWKIAEKQLMNGLSVICDSPLSGKGGYQKALELASRCNAILAIIDCECLDDGMWRERIESRATSPIHPKHKIRTFEQTQFLVKAEFQMTNAVSVDTSESLDANLAKIISFIGHTLPQDG